MKETIINLFWLVVTIIFLFRIWKATGYIIKDYEERHPKDREP